MFESMILRIIWFMVSKTWRVWSNEITSKVGKQSMRGNRHRTHFGGDGPREKGYRGDIILTSKVDIDSEYVCCALPLANGTACFYEKRNAESGMPNLRFNRSICVTTSLGDLCLEMQHDNSCIINP